MLCMCVLLYVCVGVGFVDWLEKGFIIMRGFEVCVCLWLTLIGWLKLGLWLSWIGWLKCCFTSTETVGLLGTGAQDIHLDFHTAPELCYAAEGTDLCIYRSMAEGTLYLRAAVDWRCQHPSTGSGASSIALKHAHKHEARPPRPREKERKVLWYYMWWCKEWGRL